MIVSNHHSFVRDIWHNSLIETAEGKICIIAINNNMVSHTTQWHCKYSSDLISQKTYHNAPQLVSYEVSILEKVDHVKTVLHIIMLY